jgi:hypothetical protein
MKVNLLILSLCFASNSFGQDFVFDTTKERSSANDATYYSKTDFSIIDTLQLWNYLLDTAYHSKETDSVKPRGQLAFWRTRPIDDKISKKVYGQPWTPYIAFDIFSIADTSYCFKISSSTRYLSSCVPPNVGGDIIVIDKFVFLNHNVCLGCQRYETKVDYCRPVINYVFSKIDKTKITTIESLVQQFVIARAQSPER